MELVDGIAKIGFPAAVAAFLIWWTTYQLSAKINMLCEQINNNTKAVTTLAMAIMKEKNIEPSEIKDIIGRNKNV